MSYTEHAPKSYVDSKLALKADVVALQAVSAIATALDTRLSQLARDTYTKTQIDYLTEAIKKGRFKKVDSLPEIEEAELYVIYLVPRSDPTAQNVKDEYIVIVGDGDARSWEKVGSTDVDLSGYATKEEVQGVRDSVNSLASDVDALQDDITSDSSRISTLENKVDNPSSVPTEDSNDLISSGGVFAALAGKASVADATLTERGPDKDGFSAWTIFRDGVDVTAQVAEMPHWLEYADCWVVQTTLVPGDVNAQDTVDVGPDALYLEWNCLHEGIDLVYTATRTMLPGYQLGNDDQHILASEAEAEALRQGKASKSDLDPLLFAQYYPDGSVKSAAEFTDGIKYDDPDTIDRTITVKPFCNTGDSENDNSNLSGRVVIPPFVDAQGNPYITDDGTRFKVVGVSGREQLPVSGGILTAIIAPNTVTTIGGRAFFNCTALTTVTLPAATTIGDSAFGNCSALTSVSLHAATNIGGFAFDGCRVLTSIDFGGTHRQSVPTLVNGVYVFTRVPESCTIIVPYTQYDAWTAADGWKDLPQEFVRHSEKADKPATFTAGNLAKFDAQGNPSDSTIPAANVALKSAIPYDLVTKTVTNGAVTLDDRAINAVAVSSSLASLTINFPTATSGKARDFGLRLTVASGVTTAPQIVLPQGVTCENADGEAPEIGADGAATILYFTETASGVFLVKGEVLQTITA